MNPRQQAQLFQEYERTAQQVRRAVVQVYTQAIRNMAAWQKLSNDLQSGGRFEEFAALHAEDTEGITQQHFTALFWAVGALQAAIEAMDEAKPGLFDLRRERRGEGGEAVRGVGPRRRR